MTKLVWDKIEDRTYESGVDHGVFYPNNGPGVVWNGLVSVNETKVGGEAEPFYFDGFKYLEKKTNQDFQASIQAFYPPPGFGPCDGEFELVPGFILTKQKKETFGFSYRSMINSDMDYKLHLVYNATATRSSMGYKSDTNATAPNMYNWTVTTVPNYSETFQPTAHFVISSAKTPLIIMLNLEAILYGYTGQDPRLPTYAELQAIKDELDGGTPFTPGYGVIDGLTYRLKDNQSVDGGDV